MENNTIKPRIYTVGDAHLDTSWNWTLETTIREYIPKTLHENFKLFEQYPEYVFSFEGAYRYELMEEYYPADFETLKQYVAQGRWSVTGSAYENGDVNVPSPESLFRNILYGNSYFEEKFGKRSIDIFLPDCFGFGWALPSIAKHANLNGFTTQKLTWSSAYGIPFDLGVWEGVDGSRIYASLDARTYIAVLKKARENPECRKKLEKNLKEYNLPFTYIFHGVGDKGGAPKASSAETVCRELRENASNSIDVLSASGDQVFRDMDTMLTPEQKAALPVWKTELVSTNHGVGGYTSRATGKRWNRHNEQLADSAEKAAVTAMQFGAPYNKAKLDEAWKRVIAHQFHDDIPGTSLQVCYKRNWNDYMLSLSEFAEEYRASVGQIGSLLHTSFAQGIPVVVNNPLQCARRDVVDVEVDFDEPVAHIRVFDRDGNEVPAQIVSMANSIVKIAFIADVPALGYRVYDIRPSDTGCALDTGLQVTKRSLENNKYRVVLDTNGDVVNIWDKTLDRGILDKPIRMGVHSYNGDTTYPAWELTYQEVAARPVCYAAEPDFEIMESGPARVRIRTARTAGDSIFYQTISLSATGESVEFQNEIDWRSPRSLLKTQFSLLAKNEKASYDLGLGVIERGTNTEKLYEVPAQLWADLTDESGAFGVSIFSDCKYGWDKPDDHTLRLTGMHSPVGDYRKDSKQSLLEFGLNRYGFAVYSHKGGFENGTQLHAQRFSRPLTAFLAEKHEGNLGASYSFGSVSDDGILIRAIKKAEKTDEIIVRVNEGINQQHTGVRLTLGEGIEKAREVYASEEPIGSAVCQDGALVFDIAPYAVKTFALKLKKPSAKLTPAENTPLPLPFNCGVTSPNTARSAGAFPTGESIPAELFPKQVTCGGVTFTMGSAKTGDSNALRAAGQTISIPDGVDELHLLLAAVQGDRDTSIELGGNHMRLCAFDLNEAVGAWDLFGLGETGYVKDCRVAHVFTHMHAPDEDRIAKQAYLFKYTFSIPAGARECVLPDDKNIFVFAATATKQLPKAVTASELHDRLEKRAFQFELPWKDRVISRHAKLWKLLHK